jgi:hypothetical protein
MRDSSPRRARIASSLRWGGWWVILALAIFRSLVGVEPFPFWDSDPMRLAGPLTGLTPAGSAVVDSLIALAGGAVLLGEALAGAGVMLGSSGLALIGAVGVGLHALVLHGGSLEHARIGSTWAASIIAGLAAMHACRDAALRRVTLATLFGLGMMLLAKGVLQVAVEHQLTVETYRRDPEAFLQAQGWTRDSASARNFERRLSQPEASAWFGLANVYATFAAAGLVGLTGWALLAWRQSRSKSDPLPDGWAGALSVAALGSAASLWLAGSKGGITAAGIGLSLLAGRMLLGRQVARAQLWRLTTRIAGLLAVALVVSAVGALLVRGLLGERMGELSLLFRWFYVEGATRVFLREPLFGVGPAGFKDAYMLAKPDLSPEEVQSPHSVMFDYAATLGAFGFAWIALWIVWVYRLGVAVIAPPRHTNTDAITSRPEAWYIALAAAIPTIAAAWIEQPISTPESGLARLIGLLVWVGVSLAALQLLRRDTRAVWVAALAGLTVAIHSQIEVTPVLGGAACLVTILLASAGAAPPSDQRRRFRVAAYGAALSISAAGLAWIVCIGLPMLRWERGLREAADLVAPIGQLRQRTVAVLSSRGPLPDSDSMDRIAGDLGRLLNQAPPGKAEEFERAMAALAAVRAEEASRRLELAGAQVPRHFGTREAAARMLLAAADARQSLGMRDQSERLGAEAVRIAQDATAGLPPTASAYGMLGTVWATRAGFGVNQEYLHRALEAWTAAAALDPYGLAFPLRIFKTELVLGRTESAKRWARRLLELDALQRLDPLKRLTEQERREVMKALE